MSGGLAVVLSGGGAPAAYFGAGVLQALEDRGMRADVLSGVSAGAINACAAGIGMTAGDLARMWGGIRWSDIYRPRFDVWNAINVGRLLRPTTSVVEYALGAIGWTHLLETAPARRTLTNQFGGAQVRPARGTTIVVSAVDENSGEVVRFCSKLPPPHRADPQFRQVDLTVEHILASAAVPLLFPPGRVGPNPTHRLVDAGMFANTPLAPAMHYEPDRVVVVSGSGVGRPSAEPDSLGSAIALLAENVAHYALRADLDHAETVNKLATAAPETTAKRTVPILTIEPTDLGFSVDGFLRFGPDEARALIEYGRETADKALAGWPG